MADDTGAVFGFGFDWYTPPDPTNYDTPGERARAAAALEAYKGTLDPFEIDGAQTSSGYVDPMYYINKGIGWLNYVSLPQRVQMEAQRVYSALTGGRDIASDLYSGAAAVADELTAPAIAALRAGLDKLADSGKTILTGVAIAGAVILAFVALKGE